MNGAAINLVVPFFYKEICMKKKVGLILLCSAAVFLISCMTTRISRQDLTPDLIEYLESASESGDLTVKKSFAGTIKGLFVSDDKTPAQKLQYYVKSKVVYRADTDEKTGFTITKDGRLIQTDSSKDKEFIIEDDTLGTLESRPRKVDGKYVVDVNFMDVNVPFTEESDGLFHSPLSIEYNGRTYQTEDETTLEYVLEERVKKEKKSKTAKGKKIRN